MTRNVRTNGATATPPTKAARLSTFVVVQVRHALQQAGAISAYRFRNGTQREARAPSILEV
jgi:hypothetical protein